MEIAQPSKTEGVLSLVELYLVIRFIHISGEQKRIEKMEEAKSLESELPWFDANKKMNLQ